MYVKACSTRIDVPLIRRLLHQKNRQDSSRCLRTSSANGPLLFAKCRNGCTVSQLNLGAMVLPWARARRAWRQRPTPNARRRALLTTISLSDIRAPLARVLRVAVFARALDVRLARAESGAMHGSAHPASTATFAIIAFIGSAAGAAAVPRIYRYDTRARRPALYSAAACVRSCCTRRSVLPAAPARFVRGGLAG